MSIKVYFLVLSTGQILIPTFVSGQTQQTADKQKTIKSNIQQFLLKSKSQSAVRPRDHSVAVLLHYYLKYFSLHRRMHSFYVAVRSVPLCSSNIFQLSGKKICALAVIRWDSKSKCLVLN